MIDLDAIDAIDVHVHVEVSAVDGRRSLSPELEAAADDYFGNTGADDADDGRGRPDIHELAQHYRDRSMAAVVFTVDATTAMGTEPIPSDEIAIAAGEHDDVLIPFGSVDPRMGRAAVMAVHRLVDDHDVRGFKFHPSVQGFDPDDRAFFPLWDAIATRGRIALFHTGQTGIGAGLPGGGGIRLRHSNPMMIDEVAAAFPDLDIILAHPSFPWQDEALAVATHKPRVHIDLSGWSPTYFPPQLVRYANSLLQDKVLFGSDYPMLTPDRWLRDFERLDLRDEVRPKILKHNAARLLGLAGTG